MQVVKQVANLNHLKYSHLFDGKKAIDFGHQEGHDHVDQATLWLSNVV